MWDSSSDGSLWVQTDAVIFDPPKINTCFVTALMNPQKNVSITVSLSINGSSRLISMNERVVQTSSTYCEIFRPYSYSQKRHMFYPSAVGLFQFIRCLFLISIFPKWSRQWWSWYIFDVILVRFVGVRHININLIFLNFLLLSHNF